MANTRAYIGKYMAITQRMFNAFLRYRLKCTTLNPSRFIFLIHLFAEDGQSQKQINKTLQYDKGVIARIANQLEKDGYIIRECNPNDNRAYKLHLRQKAKDFYPTMIDILSEWNEVLLADETTQDIDMLNKTLKRLAKKSINKVKELKNGQK